MKELCLLLYNVLILFAAAVNIKPKSVNVAFETVLEFDQAKHSAEVGLIDKVQSFLSNVKYVLRSGRRSYSHLHKRDPQSIEVYIREAIETVLQYPDEDLEQLLRIVKTEVRGYVENGRKFNSQETFGDEGRPVPAKYIRLFLNTALENVQEDRLQPSNKVVLEYMNMLMTDESKMKIKNIIDNLKMYGRKSKRGNSDLIPIVRNGIKDLYVHYYRNLDSNAQTLYRKIMSKLFNEVLRTYNIDFRLNALPSEARGNGYSVNHRQKKKKHLRERGRKRKKEKKESEFMGKEHINNKAFHDRKESSVESASGDSTLVVPDKDSSSSEISQEIIETTSSKAPKKKRVRIRIKTTPKTYMHTLWEEEINVDIENKNTDKPKSSDDSDEPYTYSNKRFKIQKSKKRSKKRNPTKETLKKKKPKRHREKRKEKKKHGHNTGGANKKDSFWYSKNRRSNNFEGLAIESLEESHEGQSKRRVNANSGNHSHIPTSANNNNCDMSREVATFPDLNETNNCTTRSQRNNSKMDNVLSESRENVMNSSKITARKTAEVLPVKVNDVFEIKTTTDNYITDSAKNGTDTATAGKIDNQAITETNESESTSHTSSIIINVVNDTNVVDISNKTATITNIFNETSLSNNAAIALLSTTVSTENLAKLQGVNIYENNI